MSFADYGFSVFWKPRSRPEQQSCGDWAPLKTNCGPANTSSYHMIIDHLIDLGSNTELQLKLARAEIDRYRRLQLTDEQLLALRNLESEINCSENFTITRVDYKRRALFIENHGRNDEGKSWDIAERANRHEHAYCTSVSPCQTAIGYGGDTGTELCETDNPLSDRTFRVTIIQKDSEIISLKNDKAVREAEVKELEEQNKKLETVVEKMKSDIELLESSSRLNQDHIQDFIDQKKEEIESLRTMTEKLQTELHAERHSKLISEKEVEKFQDLIRETQSLRRKLADELSATKRRLETVESANSSLSGMVKQLEQERDKCDKLQREQETEIEKLLGIVKRLNQSFEKTKEELTESQAELEKRERQVEQCRRELQAMEHEVSQLVAELADCLGQKTDSGSPSPELGVCAQARLLTRGLSQIVRDHRNCLAHRDDLLREIERLSKIDRSRVQPVRDVEAIKSDAIQEITRLKRIVMGFDNYKTIKSDIMSIMDEMLRQMDAKKNVKIEKAYKQVASEASLALEKLDKTINDHEIYRRCERFLLMELENLQEALDGAEKTIQDLELGNGSCVELQCMDLKNYRDDVGNYLTEGNDMSVIENIMSEKVLQRVRNSTQIVVRITTALRDVDSSSRITHNKELENQLEKALASLKKISSDKCELQDQLEASRKRSEEFLQEIERLKTLLNAKSTELESLSDRMNARLEANRTEKEALRKQFMATEKKFESTLKALNHENSQLVENLRIELHNKNVKLKELSEFNEYMNDKMKESNRMIEQLQSTIVQENMRKVDLDNFNALHNKILDLEREKEELKNKIPQLESRSLYFEKNNNKLHNNLAEIHKENKNLEECIRKIKEENERLVSMAKISSDNTDIGSRFDELLNRIGRITQFSKQSLDQSKNIISLSSGDAIDSGLEKELKSLKQKLLYQQNEIVNKERNIQEKNREIEALNDQIKTKEVIASESETLKKHIEKLDQEKSELKNELRQTLMKYEDKLAEMQKHYKQNEIKLHENFNDSIRRLEAKYLNMMRGEGRSLVPQNRLQSYSTSELLPESQQDSSKSPLYSSSMNERDLFESQKKRIVNNNISANPSSRKSSQSKKDVRVVKTAPSPMSKASSRQSVSARVPSYQSVNIPEKDTASQKTINGKSSATSRNKWIH